MCTKSLGSEETAMARMATDGIILAKLCLMCTYRPDAYVAVAAAPVRSFNCPTDSNGTSLPLGTGLIDVFSSSCRVVSVTFVALLLHWSLLKIAFGSRLRLCGYRIHLLTLISQTKVE